MFELALNTIQEKINSEKSSLEYYEKEINKYQKYHTEQLLKIDALEKEYEDLKLKLGFKKD